MESPDKIFVIIQGSYSDWRIKGYTVSEEYAKWFCKEYNKRKEKYQEEFYYVQVKKIGSAKNELKIYKKHKVNLFNLDGGKGFDSEWNSEDVLLHDVPPMKIEHDEYGHFIIVYLDEHNEEKAEKIAQDFYYKQLAKKEGIS